MLEVVPPLARFAANTDIKASWAPDGSPPIATMFLNAGSLRSLNDVGAFGIDVSYESAITPA